MAYNTKYQSPDTVVELIDVVLGHAAQLNMAIVLGTGLTQAAYYTLKDGRKKLGDGSILKEVELRLAMLPPDAPNTKGSVKETLRDIKLLLTPPAPVKPPVSPCPECGGTGKITKQCDSCRGTGCKEIPQSKGSSSRRERR
uniref:Putative chaperone n=1 Tax=viral metagenome TaxID=1070528 RepID=A0A6H1ZQ21_9ZZZZ